MSKPTAVMLFICARRACGAACQRVGAGKGNISVTHAGRARRRGHARSASGCRRRARTWRRARTTPAARRGAHTARACACVSSVRCTHASPTSASWRSGAREYVNGALSRALSTRWQWASTRAAQKQHHISTTTHLIRPGGGHQRRRWRRQRSGPVSVHARLRLGRCRLLAPARLASAAASRRDIRGHGSHAAAGRETRDRRTRECAGQATHELRGASSAAQRRQQQRLQRRSHAARCRRTRPHTQATRNAGSAGRRRRRRARLSSRPRHPRVQDPTEEGRCRPAAGAAMRGHAPRRGACRAQKQPHPAPGGRRGETHARRDGARREGCALTPKKIWREREAFALRGRNEMRNSCSAHGRVQARWRPPAAPPARARRRLHTASRPRVPLRCTARAAARLTRLSPPLPQRHAPPPPPPPLTTKTGRRTSRNGCAPRRARARGSARAPRLPRAATHPLRASAAARPHRRAATAAAAAVARPADEAHPPAAAGVEKRRSRTPAGVPVVARHLPVFLR
jgi:hypothetical protein